MTIRKARPLGLSLLCTQLHNKQQLDDKTIGQLINYSLNHNLSWDGRPFTIETLSDLLGISKAKAYKHYLEHTSRVANLINPGDLQGLYLGQIFSILAGASGTLSHIRNQRMVLQASQANEYVPFLTEQLNAILSTEMAAMEKMAKISESLLKGVNPNALPQPNEDSHNAEKAIGVQEALKLLEQTHGKKELYDQKALAPLKAQYLIEGTPQVIANLQVGNKEDAALVKDNKKHHRSRRSDQYGIDEEES